jgi:putative membrane protein insertion efficiency factor
MKSLFLFIWNLPANISILFLKLYQKTLSPDHGPLQKILRRPYCKYLPTCSSYTIEALKKYGFLKGWRKGIWRVLRCNPWSCGGLDLP